MAGETQRYQYEFQKLAQKYHQFQHPFVSLKVNNKDIQARYVVSDICAELTSGFEASVAAFSVYDTYDTGKSAFDFKSVMTYVFLGARVELSLGYGSVREEVFVGAVMRVSFQHEKGEIPCIRVVAMDIKGIMMSGSYAGQISAAYYSKAVEQILERTAYKKLQNKKIIRGIHVSATPDMPQNGTGGGAGLGEQQQEQTIEMVSESDYEFVVKAAKRFAFEFFTECGHVYFRKAKSDKTMLMKIAPDMGIQSFQITYDITGLVEKVTVRGMNAGNGEVFQSDKKFTNKLSQKNAAGQLLKGSSRVYLDASVFSKKDAQYRAESLMEHIAYRYGALECELVGIPELLPGHFIALEGFGTGADNCFYLTRVKHIVNKDGMYVVQLEGTCAGAAEAVSYGGIAERISGIR